LIYTKKKQQVIVRLFQSFMVTLIEEDPSAKKSGGKETKEEASRSGMTIGATLQTILNASNQLAQASQPGLKATFDGLVMELFGILANASDPDTFQIPPPSCSSSSSTRPSQTLLSLLSAPSISNTHLFGADDHDDDARVFGFVVRIGSLFVQICALLSRTDLVSVSPFFTFWPFFFFFILTDDGKFVFIDRSPNRGHPYPNDSSTSVAALRLAIPIASGLRCPPNPVFPSDLSTPPSSSSSKRRRGRYISGDPDAFREPGSDPKPPF
jgi:hypothetical protein